MAAWIQICGRCTLPANDVFNCGVKLCVCFAPELYTVWECLMCGKQHLLESDADACDKEDTVTCIIQAFEDGDINPIYFEFAQKLKNERI